MLNLRSPKRDGVGPIDDCGKSAVVLDGDGRLALPCRLIPACAVASVGFASHAFLISSGSLQ